MIDINFSLLVVLSVLYLLQVASSTRGAEQVNQAHKHLMV